MSKAKASRSSTAGPKDATIASAGMAADLVRKPVVALCAARRAWSWRCHEVLAVTSYALGGDENKALAAGCDGYVSKPYSPRELLAKVRAHFGAFSCALKQDPVTVSEFAVDGPATDRDARPSWSGCASRQLPNSLSRL